MVDEKARLVKIKRTFKRMTRAILIALVLVAVVMFVSYWRSGNDCDEHATAASNPTKAIVYCDYGSPDGLKLMEVEKPVS